MATSAHGSDFCPFGLNSFPQGIDPNSDRSLPPQRDMPNGWQCWTPTRTCIGLLDPPVRVDLGPAGLWWRWTPFGHAHVFVHRRLEGQMMEKSS